MAEGNEGFVASAIKSQKQGLDWMEKMLALARPEAVFGEPQTAGDYTVITASEAWAGMGYGFGIGGAEDGEAGDTGGGGGSGGGGVSTGRPVVVIEVGPDGVRVEQVVDFTKIALAFISVLVGLVAARSRVMRSRRQN